MKKLNLLLGAIALAVVALISFSFKVEKPTTSLSTMVTDWERAKAYTLDYINAATPEAIALKPTAEMRSFGQQMLHIAEANYGIAAVAGGKESPIAFGQLEKASDQYKTKEALVKAVSDSYDFAISTLKGMDEAKMTEKIKLFNYDLTRGAAFEKAFEHQTHHRGQTTVYLRLSGLTPPNERLF